MKDTMTSKPPAKNATQQRLREKAEQAQLIAAFQEYITNMMPKHDGDSAPEPTGKPNRRLREARARAAKVSDGDVFIVQRVGKIFASPKDWDEIGEAEIGTEVVATGCLEKSHGHLMVPIAPTGAVEWRILTKDGSANVNSPLPDSAEPPQSMKTDSVEIDLKEPEQCAQPDDIQNPSTYVETTDCRIDRSMPADPMPADPMPALNTGAPQIKSADPMPAPNTAAPLNATQQRLRQRLAARRHDAVGMKAPSDDGKATVPQSSDSDAASTKAPSDDCNPPSPERPPAQKLKRRQREKCAAEPLQQ